LLDRDSNTTPDSRPSVSAFRCSLLGTLKAIRIDHQHCDTPDLDFPYHTGTVAELVFRIV